MRRPAVIALLILAGSAAPAQELFRWEKRLHGEALGNPLSSNPLNGSTLYGSVGSAGVLYVSRDEGETWEPFATVPGGGRIKSVVQRTTDSAYFLVGQELVGADRVMRTTDAGLTWSATLTGNFSYYGVPVEYSDSHPDTVYCMTDTSVYRSADFGASWELRSHSAGFNVWCDAAVRPDDADILYIGDNLSGIWKSTDGGASFSWKFSTTGEIPMIAIDPVNPLIAYATQWAGSPNGLLKTTDGGETWSGVPALDSLGFGWGVAVSAAGPGEVIFGTYTVAPQKGLYLSSDGGSGWTKTDCGLETSSSFFNYGLLAISRELTLALQGDGIYILRRNGPPGGATGSISGTVVDSVSGAPVPARVILRYETCDGPVAVTTLTDSTGEFSIDGLEPTDTAFSTSYSLELDPGVPFAELFIENIHLDTSGLVYDFALNRADVFLTGDDPAALSGYSGYYKRALDSLGLTYNFWDATSEGEPPFARTSEFVKKILIYFGGSRTAPFTDDELSGLDSCLRSGNGVFLTGQNILEANVGKDFFRELGVRFGGNSFTTYCTGAAGDIFDSVAIFTTGSGANNQNSRDVIVADSSGIVPVLGYGNTGMGGAAGVRRNAGPDGGYVVIFGFGLEAVHTPEKRLSVLGTVVEYLDGGITVDAPWEPAPAAGTEFRVYRSYPNPFNATAGILFDIPEAGRVELEITNVLGQRVDQVAGEFAGGRHTIRWEAGDRPAGAYYYTLKFGESVRRGKMLLIR